MEFRTYKKEDAAGKARQVRMWDASLAALPTSYARLAQAARSLGDIGLPVMSPVHSAPDYEPGGGREPGGGLEIVA